MANLQDDEITRLARVEQRVADIDARGSRGLQALQNVVASNAQQLKDLDMRVNSMVPLSAAVAVLAEQVSALREDMVEFRTDRKAEQAEAQRERRQWRILYYTIAAMLVCALIGAGTVILH